MDYLPIPDRVLSHRLRQIPLNDALEPGQSLKRGKTQIEFSKNRILSLHGSDKSSHQWSFVQKVPGSVLSIYAADLDCNSFEDLIILLTNEHGTNASKTRSLLILMFEKNGRPFPWLIDGCFQADKWGLKDFIDLNKDGKAELIHQSLDSGYWITSIYEANQTRFKQLKNYDGLALPLFTKFTYRCNRQSSIPPANKIPKAANHSNDLGLFPRKPAVLIKDLAWRKSTQYSQPLLTFSDSKLFNPQVEDGKLLLLIDEPTERRISVITAVDTSRKLLQEMLERKLKLTINSKSMIYAAANTNLPQHTQQSSKRTELIETAFLKLENELP
ncbi:MAG: hypothetical protein K2X27_10385 [Candidatus Obscuribacterales bacterium]|nr:hypothetical protein [Candidatus Obscuribacterales bacterium]